MWFVNGKAWKRFSFFVGWACGREDRALQECNLSAPPSVDGGCIRPGSSAGAGIFVFRDGPQATAQSVKLILFHVLHAGLGRAVWAMNFWGG